MAKDGQELNAQKKIVQFNIDPQIDENALYQQKLKNYNTGPPSQWRVSDLGAAFFQARSCS